MARPRPEEYGSYYHSYVDLVTTDDFEAALEGEGQATQALLADLPEERGDYRYAEGKWSIKEVVGHLLDSERILAYRALSIARGETQSLPGYDHDSYVAEGNFDRRSLADLLAELRQLRQSTLTLFAGLAPETLDRSGEANDMPMTPRAIAFVLAGHEHHHRSVVEAKYL
jgi:uncharacterized damage-inducible protein DinB